MRFYELERDDTGRVVRMFWLGPQPKVEPACCRPPWQLCDKCKWQAWTSGVAPERRKAATA